eukprot:6349889-Alexandrium_andersonii.AAC.1
MSPPTTSRSPKRSTRPSRRSAPPGSGPGSSSCRTPPSSIASRDACPRLEGESGLREPKGHETALANP